MGVHFEDSVDSSSLAMSETSATSAGGKVKAQKQKGELDEQLRDYINEWRKQREKEEAEIKRQEMMQAQKEKQQAAGKGGGAKASAGAGVQDARKEMTKTKEQLEGKEIRAEQEKKL